MGGSHPPIVCFAFYNESQRSAARTTRGFGNDFDACCCRSDFVCLITHHFPAEQFQTGFDIMRSGQSGKVILDWA